MNDAQTRLIATALYEIRLLLSPHVGSENAAQPEVRLAAQLAYALHNEASALANDRSFDIIAALKKVAAIDNLLGTDDGSRLANTWVTVINRDG